MEKPLTYQNLRCVVEYLEANKRIRIAARCPAIHKIDRKIPLHLDHLNIDTASISLNNITYHLCSLKHHDTGLNGNCKIDILDFGLNQDGIYDESADDIIFDGDILLKPSDDLKREKLETANTNCNRSHRPVYLYFKRLPSLNDLNNRVPAYLKFHEAMKLLTSYLFGSRPDIFVRRLTIFDFSFSKILRLPLNLKLQAQEFEANPYQLEYLLPFIKCKILKTTCNWNDSCFELPMVQSVQKLFIICYSLKETSWNKTLLKLPNTDIKLNHTYLSSDEIKKFILGLLEEGRKIGTCYTIFHSYYKTLAISKEIGERFGRKAIEKCTKDENYPYPFSYSILLPINATTELFISGFKNKNGCHTRMKAVPINSMK